MDHRIDNSTIVRFVVLDACDLVCGQEAPEFKDFRCTPNMDAQTSIASRRRQYEWMENVLSMPPPKALGRDDDDVSRMWTVVVGHWGVYSFAGNGDTPELISNLVPLLEKYKVHAYFNGHDHAMQHVRKGNIQYFTSGAGGYVLHDLKPQARARPELVHVDMTNGFMWVQVSHDTFRVQFVDGATTEILYTTDVPFILYRCTEDNRFAVDATEDGGQQSTTTPMSLPRWKRKKKVDEAAPSPVHKSKKVVTNDRFIPNRSAMNMAASSFKITAHFETKAKPNSRDASTSSTPTPKKHASSSTTNTPIKPTFQACLAESLLGTSDLEHHRILTFKEKPVPPHDPASFQGALDVMYRHKAAKRGVCDKEKPVRHIPTAATKVLDAPELMDDYYLNLLSWGNNNVLAVALGPSMYLWNAATGEIDELMSLEGDDYICSVSWIQDGHTLAIGTSDATIQLWDAHAARHLRTLRGHSLRVGALSWNQHVLSSGSRDTTIKHHDVRIQQPLVATLNGHDQEVCGLAWSPDGTKLASGGNDNMLCIWNHPSGSSSSARPVHKLHHHVAAVKALAWCPWERHVLASGGGTADRTIKLWNVQTGSLLQSVDTGSQVCALLWAASDKELLSSHGYAQNELCLWEYPSMVKIKELTGHTARVLHMAASPDKMTVVSGAADETLRFWNIFAPPKKPAKKTAGFWDDKASSGKHPHRLSSHHPFTGIR
ncbi:hypothetical protein DYB25_002946 [Aphanomyces astaci]|uniref:CDC20/Fizzy WD40 domain-containing protein n=1 Tax=Aphanomyces astaci TaxID=112090 RepID=A0A397BDX7_APHAT|nr:hypothetical protein DYB25_002946 [Aphanomyces astaci]